jgi:hypothetical protein
MEIKEINIIALPKDLLGPKRILISLNNFRKIVLIKKVI